MSTATLPPMDPVEVILHLDPAEIRARLEAIAREREALLVLLRAALRNRPNRTARKAVQGAS